MDTPELSECTARLTSLDENIRTLRSVSYLPRAPQPPLPLCPFIFFNPFLLHHSFWPNLTILYLCATGTGASKECQGGRGEEP